MYLSVLIFCIINDFDIQIQKCNVKDKLQCRHANYGFLAIDTYETIYPDSKFNLCIVGTKNCIIKY